MCNNTVNKHMYLPKYFYTFNTSLWLLMFILILSKQEVVNISVIIPRKQTAENYRFHLRHQSGKTSGRDLISTLLKMD